MTIYIRLEKTMFFFFSLIKFVMAIGVIEWGKRGKRLYDNAKEKYQFHLDACSNYLG